MRNLNVKLAVSLALLVLPLAAGGWAFANFAAGGDERRSNARLQTAIDRGIDRFANALEEARLDAKRLAGRRDVQRALARSDRDTLARLAQQENASFTTAAGDVVGRPRGGAPERAVEVVLGRRRVGRVAVGVPLDDALARRLLATSGLRRGSLVAFAREGRVLAPARLADAALSSSIDRFETVRLNGVEYRALSARLVRGRRGVVLAALEPAGPIAAAERRTRLRILGAGAIVLLAFGLVGYAVAPGVARGRAVRSQRAQAARVLSHLAEGVLFLDRDGIVRLWNPTAERITGLSADAVESRSAEEAIPGWREIQPRIPVAPAAGASEARPETVPFSAAGRELWLSVSGVEFADGTVYAFRDLTGERRLEEVKRDFVATVSHELRTPVASVYGAAQTLRAHKDRLTDETRESLLAVVTEESERLARLVEQILLADQLDSGQLDVRSGTVDAVAVARSVVEAARPRLGEELSIDLVAPSALPRVVADSERVRQVLANLVDNAVKYSPEGGRISVELERGNGRVRFTVRDEGLGIPPEEHGRIFEKFQRLDAEMVRGIGGSGLGLYISRALVHQMDGSISVASQPGVGSAFSIELPIAASG